MHFGTECGSFLSSERQKSEKMKLTKYILGIGLSIMSFSLTAQDWNLDQCIRYAIDNNIQIKRQELQAESARKNHFQSKMELLPNLNASGNHYYNTGKAINYETYEYVNENFQGGSVSFGSEITLFHGLQNYNSIKKSKFDLMTQLENVDKAKNDVVINVTTAYLNVIFNEELTQTAKLQWEVSLDRIEKTEKMVKLGKSPKGDLLEIKSQAAQEKVTYIQNKNNLSLAYLELIQLLNLDTIPSKFKVILPEYPEIAAASNLNEPETIYEDALDFLPEIKAAEYNLQSTKKQHAINLGNLSPRIAFGYSNSSRYNELNRRVIGDQLVTQVIGETAGGEQVFADYYNNVYADNYPYFDQIRDNNSSGIYLSLNVPIFRNWRRANQISQSKIDIKDARYHLEEQKQFLYKEIQQAQQEATAALDKYKANMEALESLREAFQYTEEEYEIGLVDVLEYKVAKNNLSQAQSDLLQAKYEFIFKTKILDFYQGQEIKL